MSTNIPNENNNTTSPKANSGHMELLRQLYRESHAMADYAFSNGLDVQASAVTVLEAFKPSGAPLEQSVPGSANTNIQALVTIHNQLSSLISPAKPRTIVLLEDEKREKNAFRFLGPDALIRQMMLVALVCLALFIVLALSKSVDSNGGYILTTSGLPLLLNLLFYLSAAGLGAAFAALYKANYYITNRTYDPTYDSSYWINFFLGLISGLLLAVLISNSAFNNSQMPNTLLVPGIVRPLLAILGGFSANLFYTVLSRIVETVESLFTGSPKDLIAMKANADKNQLAQKQTKQQFKVATKLLTLHQELSQSGQTEHAAKVTKLISDVTSGGDAEIPNVPSTTPGNQTPPATAVN